VLRHDSHCLAYPRYPVSLECDVVEKVVEALSFSRVHHKITVELENMNVSRREGPLFQMCVADIQTANRRENMRERFT
jgi:hypothetical protein